MKIINSEIKIKKPEIINTEYIEQELSRLNIKALRWAIVDVNETDYTLNVSYFEN